MVMEIVISILLLFVGIAVLVVIHICIVGRAFREGYHSGVLVSRTNKGIAKITNDDLKSLPCFDYNSSNKEMGNSSLDCAVCLENLKDGDKCRLLPNCGHSFHCYCIDSWLLKMPICPVCRTSIVTTTPSSSSVVEAGSGGPHSRDAVVVELS